MASPAPGRNGLLNRTLRGSRMGRRALERSDFCNSCYLKDYWVCCEWAFVLKGFAARESGGRFL